MTEEEYMNERVDDQIDWYDKKSQNAQRWFKSLRFIELLVAALIPIVSGFGENYLDIQFTVAVMGAVVLVTSAIISLNRYQENWIKYRTTCESLKHEKYLFSTRSEPYDIDAPFPLFTKRVENLVSKEHSEWMQYTRTCAELTKSHQTDS